jgi:hypothetical protein
MPGPTRGSAQRTALTVVTGGLALVLMLTMSGCQLGAHQTPTPTVPTPTTPLDADHSRKPQRSAGHSNASPDWSGRVVLVGAGVGAGDAAATF